MKNHIINIMDSFTVRCHPGRIRRRRKVFFFTSYRTENEKKKERKIHLLNNSIISFAYPITSRFKIHSKNARFFFLYVTIDKWNRGNFFLLFLSNQYVNKHIAPLADGGEIWRRFLIDNELLVDGFASSNNIVIRFFLSQEFI